MEQQLFFRLNIGVSIAKRITTHKKTTTNNAQCLNLEEL